MLSFWYFYSEFCFSKDVNDRENPHKKAPTWTYLKKFLTIIESHRRIIVLKMRQMFFSTFAVLYVLWLLLFSDTPQQILIISESLKKAYDKTDASLTGRLMYAYKYLPDFLKTTLEVSTFPQIVIRSAVTGVTVTMSATAPSSGRGASYDLTIVDEYAWHDAYVATDLISSLAPMSYRLWVISSPRGHNHFWRLISQANSGELEGFYFWDATKEQVDADDVQRIRIYNELIQATPLKDRAREFGGSFDETQEGKVFPDFDMAKSYLERRLLKEELFRVPKVGGMDYGIGDNTALVLFGEKDGMLLKILAFEMNNCLPEAFYNAVLGELMREYDLTELEARQIVGTTVIYGDYSANNRSQTHDTTLMKEYKKLGMQYLRPTMPASIKDGILAIHQLIHDGKIREFYEPIKAEFMLSTHIKNCHYPIANSGVIITTDKYEHDSIAFSSHLIDALRYMALNHLRKATLQGFEEAPGVIAELERKSEQIQPVFVGKIIDFKGNVIAGFRNEGTNLT